MTAVVGEDWAVWARRLADKLTADGDLHSPQWLDAVLAVPRHELVPRYWEQHGAQWRLVEPPEQKAQRADWLERVYSDITLVTALAETDSGRKMPISSSTKPDLMIRMLEALDVHNGHRVLEIGTGTGYNAALLSHRLGDTGVFSIDLRTELVDTARERLQRIGYHPFLDARDGSAGLPEHGPYDRIIATCSVSAIPTAWIEQTCPGGMILVDVEGQLSAGNLVALHRGAEAIVEGRFLDWYGRFMPLRHDPGDVGHPGRRPDRSGGTERTTTVDPTALDDAFRFLAQFHLPTDTHHTLAIDNGHPTATCLSSGDGSWCEVDRTPDGQGRHQVREGGPQRLWNLVEVAHTQWIDLGEPAWHRFGITATPDEQRVWLDSPDSDHTWLVRG